MKAIWLLVIFLFITTASFMYHACSRKGRTALNPVIFFCFGFNAIVIIIAVTESVLSRNAMALRASSRKLKDFMDPPSPDLNDKGYANLEDYEPIDPVPNWKASIRPGPIQHEAPLMPYIPQPAALPSPSQQQKSDDWYH